MFRPACCAAEDVRPPSSRESDRKIRVGMELGVQGGSAMGLACGCLWIERNEANSKTKITIVAGCLSTEKMRPIAKLM